MKTFKGRKKLKESLVKELKEHKRLDAFIQGEWISDEETANGNLKGCFYGCTMQTDDHPLLKFSEKYDIDLWYVHLTEKLYEGLPTGEYQNFPLEAIEVLPLNFDINKIKSKFHHALLMDEENGQINYCVENKECKEAVELCANLFNVDYDKIDVSAAYSAYSAACSAADSARSVADSAG